MPSDEGEREAQAMENWFQACASDEPFALELVGTRREQGFVLRASSQTQLALLCKQLEAQYPQAQIQRIAPSADPLLLHPGEHATIGEREVVIPLTSHAKRLQLLAYIGWRRGEMIDREKVLEQVFGWGLSDEEATEDKLTERFESHKKLLRRKIREVATGVNVAAGTLLLDPDIDPFVFDTGFWGLSGRCRVEDLSVIEAHHTVIAQARKEGRLVEEVPDDVKEACDRLIEQYPGDFLETMISKHAGEFRPFQGRSSWARKPFTLFRDYYLDALWYAAEYHMQHGQRCLSEHTEEEGPVSQNTQQAHYARAAQGYQAYALYACNTRFDAKVTITVHGEYGERIGMSERALRRCVVLLGLLGKTDDVNQVWSAYLAQMKTTFC